MSLTKSDFYFGALLSRLMKTGSVPAILEGGSTRRIYSVINDHGEFEIYTKYISSPRENRNEKCWDFQFPEDEIKEIKRMQKNENKIIIFALVCAVEELMSSEIVFLTYGELRECIGIDYQTKNRRVSIVLINRSWSFLAYGTGLNRKPNAIKI